MSRLVYQSHWEVYEREELERNYLSVRWIRYGCGLKFNEFIAHTFFTTLSLSNALSSDMNIFNDTQRFELNGAIHCLNYSTMHSLVPRKSKGTLVFGSTAPSISLPNRQVVTQTEIEEIWRIHSICRFLSNKNDLSLLVVSAVSSIARP